MKELQLGDDRWCFACGQKNPHGLKLVFELEQGDSLRTSFTFRKEHQGYTDIVHGGLIGLILDEAMLNLAWRLGYRAVTARLDVRLSKAVKVGETVTFRARIAGRSRRLLSAEAEARDAGGELVARAGAKCMLVDRKPGREISSPPGGKRRSEDNEGRDGADKHDGGRSEGQRA